MYREGFYCEISMAVRSKVSEGIEGNMICTYLRLYNSNDFSHNALKYLPRIELFPHLWETNQALKV